MDILKEDPSKPERIIRVGLLRHGEVKGGARFRGQTDDPLTEIGWQQMQFATQNQCWQRVLSSPLARCAAFAKAFAAQHKLPLTFDHRFTELNFGAWEGRTTAEIMAITPDALSYFWKNPDQYPPPEGERFSHFQSRVEAAWCSLIYSNTRQPVLLVTHGGVIRILLCRARCWPVSRLLDIEVKLGTLYNVNIPINSLSEKYFET